MRTQYLFNKILVSVSENRLVFQQAGETIPPPDSPDHPAAAPAQAPKPADAAKPPEAPAAAPTTKKAGTEVAEGLVKPSANAEVTAKIDEVNKKIADLKALAEPASKNEGDKYTKGLALEAKNVMSRIAQAEALVKDPKALEKKGKLAKLEKDSKKFDEDLKVFTAENIAANQKAEADLIQARTKLEASKKAVTADLVIAALKFDAKEVEAKKKEYKIDEKIKAVFAQVEASLKDDPKATTEEIQARADKASADLDIFTVDYFSKAIEGNEKQKSLSKKAYEYMTAANEGKALDFKVEDLEKVMGFYEPGQYESPKEMAKTKVIMEALKKNEDVLKKKGLDLAFLAGTDGLSHKENFDKKYNDDKKAAFEGLLSFNTAGKLEAGLLDQPKIALITAYNQAVTDNKVKEFFTEGPDAAARVSAFRDGKGLFDLALAYQRAQDRKQKFTGKKDDVLDPATDTLHLELGSETALKNDERKSGIVFVEGKVEAPAAPETATAKPYTMEYTGGKLTVKFADEEKPKEYIVSMPTGMNAQPVSDNLGDDLTFKLGVDAVGMYFNKDKSLKAYPLSNETNLMRSYSINIDEVGKTIKVTKRPKDVDHEYSYDPDKKALTVKKMGETDTKTYTIKVPDEVKLVATDNLDGDYSLKAYVGDKHAYIDFDETTGNFKTTGPTDDTKDLRNTYVISLDEATKVISIKPKEAAAAPETPPAAVPAAASVPAPEAPPAVADKPSVSGTTQPAAVPTPAPAPVPAPEAPPAVITPLGAKVAPKPADNTAPAAVSDTPPDSSDKVAFEAWSKNIVEKNKDKVKKFELPDAGDKDETDKKFEAKATALLKEFESFVKPKGISVVDFSAEKACPACASFKPIFYQMAGKGLESGSNKVRFASFTEAMLSDFQKSNILKKELHEKYGLVAVPCILIFKDGKFISRSGPEKNRETFEKELKNLIDLSGKNNDIFVDDTYLKLKDSIDNGKIESDEKNTVANFSSRINIAEAKHWEAIAPVQLGFEKCQAATFHSSSVLRYKKADNKYVYIFEGKLINPGSQIDTAKMAKEKAKIKGFLADFDAKYNNIDGMFSKVGEPKYDENANVWSVTLEPSQKFKDHEAQNRKENADAHQADDGYLVSGASGTLERIYMKEKQEHDGFGWTIQNVENNYENRIYFLPDSTPLN